jgi:ATP-dependent Clp protease protease subunit
MNPLELMPQSRYILPQFEQQTARGSKSQDPYSRLFEERVIFLTTQIDDIAASDVISQLMVLESLDSDQDITIYINSGGGSMTSLASILDTMQYIGPHVSTVCLGAASSAAAILLAGGQKGKRYALPNSRIMIHQPSSPGGPGQASDIEIQAQEIERMKTWLSDSLVSFTGQTAEKINRDISRDKFLTAPEALEYGIIDEILASRKKS